MKFLLYEPIHEAGVKVLEAVGEVCLAGGTDEDTIIREIGDVDGVVVRANGGLTRRIMEHAPKLKVAGRHGVGVDNIDLQAATEFGIQVVNTPLAVMEGVVEHTVGMMLALSKGIPLCDHAIRNDDYAIRYRFSGRELRGRTVGVIGFGRIGRRVAQSCYHGFGMQVLYTDVMAAPELEAEIGAKKVEMRELLQTADYITVHTPLLPETRHLIGAEEFALMRPDAMFFNLSRGPVVDEAALYEALASGRIAGAGLDVFEKEPIQPDNPLLGLENVVLTPHSATATEEALRDMSLVATDVVAVLQGQTPRFPVNRLNG